MLARVLAIALHTYREAVRARVLLGVFVLAFATCIYSLFVANLSLHNEARVVADLGAASFSLYGAVIAVVLGSTSLHRELEHKTIFPILSRPIRREEYLVGKYLGALLTVAVFVALDAALVLLLLALESGQAPWKLGAGAAAAFGLLALGLRRARGARVYVAIPWSLVALAGAWLVAAPAFDERQLVIASAALAVSEMAIIAAVTTLFSSFSSPFLTAVLTTMLFAIGRSADGLARLPPKVVGAPVAAAGRTIARVVPNLHAYVPPRSLLLGEVAAAPVWPYVGAAAFHAALYATALLAAGALAFARRDFA
ncbi:MAG: ABC transporter permease subunit [Myxococcales bacterium]|nr:ABC transporter permease subunit [Myxococcales bacterium]